MSVDVLIGLAQAFAPPVMGAICYRWGWIDGKKNPKE